MPDKSNKLRETIVEPPTTSRTVFPTPTVPPIWEKTIAPKPKEPKPPRLAWKPSFDYAEPPTSKSPIQPDYPIPPPEPPKEPAATPTSKPKAKATSSEFFKGDYYTEEDDNELFPQMEMMNNPLLAFLASSEPAILRRRKTLKKQAMKLRRSGLRFRPGSSK